MFDIDPYRLRSPEFFKFVIIERDLALESGRHRRKRPSDFICVLCGSAGYDEFFEYDGYRLNQCRACGVVSPNVDVTSPDNVEVYQTPVYEETVRREYLSTYQYRRETFGRERARYVEAETSVRLRDAKVLDVGCGQGYFLDVLKEIGADAKGLDLMDFNIQMCRQRGLNVRKATVELENDGEYDLVTAFDVIEHLSEPSKFFKDVSRILKPGGYFLAFTPNIHSLAFQCLRENVSVLMPYEHLCFYNEKSFRFVADTASIDVVNVDYFGLDVMDILLFKEYQDGHKYCLDLKDELPYIQAVVDRQKVSNSMRVLWKKQGRL